MPNRSHILLVDDNPDDVELTLVALQSTKMGNNVQVVRDGVEAMQYLRQETSYASALRPSLVLLDLNMPRKDGREVLGEMKKDPALRKIPVIILTTSQADEDVAQSYDLHANCFMSKPVDLSELVKALQRLEDFWFSVVKLPN